MFKFRVIRIADNFRWIYGDDVLKLPAVWSAQSVLGAEGLSLAFRHIVSSLLWYCTQHSSEELLHEVIICVGYFTVNHPDNQVTTSSDPSKLRTVLGELKLKNVSYIFILSPYQVWKWTFCPSVLIKFVILVVLFCMRSALMWCLLLYLLYFSLVLIVFLHIRSTI